MTTGQKKTLYGFLCGGALLVSLSGSLIMNVRPYILHNDVWMATVQISLALGAAAVPVAMETDLHPVWKLFGVGLLGVLFTVCLGNGIESSTLTRSDSSFARANKITTQAGWNTQIEQWKADKRALENIYTPTSQDDLKVAQERKDTACKLPASTECKNAQSALVATAHNLGLTQRVDKIEDDIRTANAELRKLGAAPPDHLKEASDALPIDLMKNRPAWMAFGCEGLAAIGMKFFMALINSLFAKAFGPKWWEVESPRIESPHPIESLDVPFKPRAPIRRIASESPKRLRCAPGVQAWVRQALPNPGTKGQRFSTTEALPHYLAFCEQEGIEACQIGLFGSILLKECGLSYAAKRGGVGYYEFNIPKSPQVTKLALVKVGG